MFANFNISPAGLTEARATKRHSRTGSGCLTCRRRKKKCSEEKPVCSRCRRNPSKPCIWEPALSSPSFKPTRLSIEASAAAGFDTLLPDGESGNESCLSLTLFVAPNLDNNSVPRSPANRMSQFESLNFIEHLLNKFSEASSLPYVNPNAALLTHSIPCAFESPPLMHAYAACGAALLSKSGYQWEQVAMNHYNKAVNSVRNALGSYKHYNRNEWLLATVNALHIFETIRQDVKSPNRIHLDGAKRLYHMSLTSNASENKLFKILLEEFIFQFAIASTFTSRQDASGTRYEDLQDLLRVLVGNCKDADLWRESALLGVSHDLFGYVFKLSYLRRKVPLQGHDYIEAVIILTRLQAWSAPAAEISTNFDSSEATGPPYEMIIMARLYHAASVILVSKIINPALSTNDPVVREMVGSGQEILQNVPDYKWQQATVLIWPLLILGIAAVSAEERRCFDRPLKFLLSTMNIGCVKTVLSLLENAWAPCPNPYANQCLGLDVLFCDDLLCGVVF